MLYLALTGRKPFPAMNPRCARSADARDAGARIGRGARAAGRICAIVTVVSTAIPCSAERGRDSRSPRIGLVQARRHPRARARGGLHRTRTRAPRADARHRADVRGLGRNAAARIAGHRQSVLVTICSTKSRENERADPRRLSWIGVAAVQCDRRDRRPIARAARGPSPAIDRVLGQSVAMTPVSDARFSVSHDVESRRMSTLILPATPALAMARGGGAARAARRDRG
jgi:hypothetical protein